ncbi:MAG TPA: TlpA disulfide reductase family protein [Flavipsychrobacter sp.]|nr:TlpA disulfide reductase family protein [Flavipsychrobacter sp.]
MRSLSGYFLLAVSLFWLASCTSNKNKFTVIGNINNMPSQEVTLDEISPNDIITVIDSTKTSETGSFELSGIAPEPGLYRLRFQQDKFILLSVDKGDIKVSGDWNMLENYNVNGSSASLSLRNFLFAIREHLRDFNTMHIVLDSMKAKGNDSALTSAKKDFDDMVTGFTRYVEQYADTTHFAPNAIFAARILNIRTEKDFLNAFVQGLDRRFPNLKIIKDYETYYAQASSSLNPPTTSSRPEIGAIAPDLNLPTPEGKMVSLSSLKGKYVLLDFWASWCGPCRAENPNVVAAYNKYKDKKFVILSVSLDNNKNAWLAAIKKDNLTWTHVSDLKGWESSAARVYDIESIPSNFLIDPSGKIIDRDLRGDALEERLSSILK